MFQGWDSMLPLLGAQVRFLVGELGSHKLFSADIIIPPLIIFIMIIFEMVILDFPGGTVSKQSACQCRGHRFDRWSRT